MSKTAEAVEKIQQEILPHAAKVAIPGNPATGQIDFGFIAQMAFQIRLLDLQAKIADTRAAAILEYMMTWPELTMDDYSKNLDIHVAAALDKLREQMVQDIKAVERQTSNLILPKGIVPEKQKLMIGK